MKESMIFRVGEKTELVAYNLKMHQIVGNLR